MLGTHWFSIPSITTVSACFWMTPLHWCSISRHGKKTQQNQHSELLWAEKSISISGQQVITGFEIVFFGKLSSSWHLTLNMVIWQLVCEQNVPVCLFCLDQNVCPHSFFQNAPTTKSTNVYWEFFLGQFCLFQCLPKSGTFVVQGWLSICLH